MSVDIYVNEHPQDSDLIDVAGACVTWNGCPVASSKAPKPSLPEIGRRVKELRLARGLEQVDLAALVTASGVALDQSQISRLEKGERGLGPGPIIVIARVLGSTM